LSIPCAESAQTLIEATDLGRRAVDVELETLGRDWRAPTSITYTRRSAQALTRARRRGQRARIAARAHSAGTATARSRAQHAARPIASGAVDLILTSPPYAREVADVNQIGGPDPIRRTDSRDRSNLGHARGDRYLMAMSDVYRACAASPEARRIPRCRDEANGGNSNA
jgi:hypothetical protein